MNVVTRRDVEVAEDAARAHLLDVRNPEREGWTCSDCPDENGYSEPPERGTWLWDDGEGNRTPLCHFHADERVHDAIPYGSNCSQCGKRHSALWPDGEPLFDRERD
jgi:hypothetical protein